MANVKRSESGFDGDPLSPREPAEYRYDAGGPIAQLQADLAQRLLSGQAVPQPMPAAPSPGERLVRLASVAGGYSALLAGYAVAALAIAYWL